MLFTHDSIFFALERCGGSNWEEKNGRKGFEEKLGEGKLREKKTRWWWEK